MGTTYRYNHEVEAQLKNIELRNALEPYYDESISNLEFSCLPLEEENDYLASMLEWERARVLPIYRWFYPELCPPRPSLLNDQDLSDILDFLIIKLKEKFIYLDFADHLSDRELYTIIWRDILPSENKPILRRKEAMHWDCAHINGDPEIWLRYYASEEERQIWSETYCQPLPPVEKPKYSNRHR